MVTSEQTDKIFPALVAAQGAITNAKKTAENPFFNSKYADLATILDVAREPLKAAGLAVIQSPTTGDGKVTVTTRIIHISGQWIESALVFEVVKKDPQSVGSAITYGRRYSLAAILGIAQEDDDGNAGSDPTPNKQKAAPQPPAKPKGNIQNAFNAITGAVDTETIEKIRKKLPNSIWTEEESIKIEEAIVARVEALEGAK